MWPSQIKKLVAQLLVRQGPTSHFTTARETDRTDTQIPGTEILGRIFTSAPGGVAAPKKLPRDFLYLWLSKLGTDFQENETERRQSTLRPVKISTEYLAQIETAISMNTASKLGPHTQTDRGTCPGVGL